MATGLGWSIYFMLILVFALMGTIAVLVWRTIRNDERREAARKSAAMGKIPPGTGVPGVGSTGPGIAPE